MQDEFKPADQERFDEALRRFDDANAADPNREPNNSTGRPRELVYADWLTEWVLRLNPNASEALRLAARCQHIRRWEIPRASYPMTREGYLKWKEMLKRKHAQISGDILREAGYPKEMIQRVQSLNLKRNLKQDEDCQVLEDALCCVFIEHQLPILATRTTREKVVVALQKSWAKMSDAGRSAALQLHLDDSAQQLIKEALSA